MNLTGNLFILAIIYPLTGIGQLLNYDVMHGDHKIGHIQVDRKQQGLQETYLVESEVDFKILWKTHQHLSKMEVVFEKGKLLRSTSEAWQNDKLDIQSLIWFDGDNYDGVFHNGDSVNIDVPIELSAVQLYYQEPTDHQQVFLESFLEFGRFEQPAAGVYEIKTPNGRRNTYSYENGKLMELKVEGTWFTITFKRQSG